MNKITTLPTRSLKQPFKLAWLLLWFVSLVACTVQSEIGPTGLPVQETEIAQVTVIALPTSTATRKPAATPTASLTPSLMVTTTSTAAEPTATPTVTATPLPTSTLTPEEMRQQWQAIDARVEAIMAPNNDCQLPCWWGIESGESVADAWQVFDTINENAWVDSPSQRGELQQIGFFDHFYRDEIGEPIYASFLVNLLVQADAIKVIDIYVGRSVTFDLGTPEYLQIGERLVRDWEQYSLQNMFGAFGKPDMINLLPVPYGDDLYYFVNIYYPDLGIAISYFPPVSVNDRGERTICPNMFDLLSMSLFLYEPGTELPADYLQATYLLWPLSPEPIDEYVESSDLESRTGMSVDEFVALMLDDEQGNTCFTVLP